MTARWLLNLGLFLAVALAAAALYFKSEPPAHERLTLVPVPAGELRRITIERPPNADIVLAREEGTWRMVAPINARLDEIALGRLLDLTRIQAVGRLSGDDASRYELDKPWARVRFEQHVVVFGMTNPIMQELYVRSGSQVHAIPVRHASAIPTNVAKLLAHRMFAAEEIPAAFRFERFSLRHDGVRWQLEPPNPRLSQDDLIRWVEQWRLASSLTTQPGQNVTGAVPIRVGLRDGRSLSFSVVATTPDLVLHRTDEGLDYHFPSDMATALLAPPGGTGTSGR